MKIFITMKQIGQKRDFLTRKEYYFDEAPASLRILIKELVRRQVFEYNERKPNEPARCFFSEEEIRQTEETLGKVGFDIRYSVQRVNETEAISAAMLAFNDGLVRIFLDETEQTELDTPLKMSDGQTLTLIKLVLLA